MKRVVAVVALVIGLVAGAACTHTAYWADTCVGSVDGDWKYRCGVIRLNA